MPQGSSYKSCRMIGIDYFMLTMMMMSTANLTDRQKIYYLAAQRAGKDLFQKDYIAAVSKMTYFMDRPVSELLENTDLLQNFRKYFDHIMNNIICLEHAERFAGFPAAVRIRIRNAIDLYRRLERIYNYLDQGYDEVAIIAQEGDIFDDEDDVVQGGGGAAAGAAAGGGGADRLDALFDEDEDEEQGGADDEEQGGDDACDAENDADCDEIDDGLGDV